LKTYQLHPLAAAEFEAIIRYTRQEWGDAQAAKYGGLLIKSMQRCLEKPDLGKPLLPGHKLRVLRSEHHYIVYEAIPSGDVLIIAILHERMNIDERVAGRLKDL
jgi:toxin ParE1/3/4